MRKEMFVFSGYIKSDGDVIIKVLKSFLKSSKIRDRYAVDIQREIKYEDDKIEIYIFDELIELNEPDHAYLFQAEFKGNLEEAETFIETIVSKLREKEIEHMFEWSEVDDNDKEVGEEFEIRYP